MPNPFVSLKANFEALEQTIEQVKKMAANANADVLVGFRGGQQHVPTLHHERDENGKEGKGYKGYHGEDNPQDEIPMEVAELAKILTYGSANIPPRPFLEEGILSKKDELKAEIGNQLEKVKNGKMANWDKVGTKAVGAITEFVRGDYYKSTVPNSPKTIQYKGSDTPLIDGGNLIQSLTYIVEEG